MSFGSPTPVEVAVSGPSFDDTKAHAEKIRNALAAVPTLRDIRYAQALDYPAVRVSIDRRRAGASDVTTDQIARSLVAATSSSRFVVPNYWPDPKSGIGYQVQVEIPYEIMDSVNDIATLPVQRTAAGGVLLRDVADVSRTTMPGQFDRYNMKRTVSLTANVTGEDLGRAASRVAAAVAAAGEPPKGVKVDLRGQIAPLWEILRGLSIGLVASVAVILLVLTAAFQSVRLALVAVAAAPAVLAGVTLALGLSGTTINLQSFMGAIMALGVSTANAILLVSFAERERMAGLPATEAAVVAARDRLRPILMTSIAMIVGMIPLAIGAGEAGGQTAPLGRAVIGGLLASTVATLLLLPAVFALVMGGISRASASLHPFDSESSRYVPALLLLAICCGCGKPSAPPAPAATGGEAATPVPLVSVGTPTRVTLRRVTTQPGQVEPFEVTELHAKVAGFVERVHVDIGDAVKAGDLLAELTLPELAAERDQKTALIDQAVAELRQAEARRKVAAANREAAAARVDEVKAAIIRAEADVARQASELRRTEQLVAEGAVTEALADEIRNRLAAVKAARDEVDATVRSAEAAIAQAEAGIEQADSGIAAAQSRVAVAKADRAHIEALLEYGRIVAPFDGTIRSRLIHPGFLTTPDGGGEPLFVVTRSDTLRVVVAVPEIDAAFVDVGDPVEIRLQALPGLVINGTVARTASSLDDATRTLRAEIDLDNRAHPDASESRAAAPQLRPGLYATTTIVAETHPDTLTVPETAVVRDLDGSTACFVIDNDRASRRPVTTGLRENGLVEIVAGLDGTERVVTAGAASLTHGQRARTE
jgi:RND family efflux transporter MFP subunit